MDLNELIDQKEIDEALESDPDVVKAKIELATKAVEYWKSIYPVEHDQRTTPPRPPGTGRDSIHVVVTPRAVAAVNDDEIAHILEYGSVNVHEYATRARTEDHFNHGGAE